MVGDFNKGRVLRRVNCTRRQLFHELDQTALRPLPVECYVLWVLEPLDDEARHDLLEIREDR
ncbi:hypothetical protein CO656_28935 [Sinorhizobium sp. FG01]|nr:hypothetical protein CO656_28935 [Sinorhizobium sp. FG01]PDT47714.1 hypothetical protein CO664_29665 [Sinorhizobium sp. NG07B]